MKTLYYEAHITIEPIFNEDFLKIKNIAELHGFKIANLLMQKRKEDTPERSKYDTFMTSHGQDFNIMKNKIIAVINSMQSYGFKVYRYKIEDVIVDSRNNDSFEILK